MLGLGLGLDRIHKKSASAPAVSGKMFSSLPENENYIDTGIAPVDSADWYWEVYCRMPKTDNTNSFPGTLDGSVFYDFGIYDGKWMIDYKGGYGESIAVADTEFHVIKYTGNGKFYIDEVLVIEVTDTDDMPDTSLCLLNFPLTIIPEYGFYGYSDWIYSKIVNNNTVLQHIDFCTAGDGFVFDRVTGNKFTINGTISEGSWSDQTEYNNLQDGYDIWKKDADNSLIYVPYDLNGDPILTSGDTLTGYTWVSTNP